MEKNKENRKCWEGIKNFSRMDRESLTDNMTIRAAGASK